MKKAIYLAIVIDLIMVLSCNLITSCMSAANEKEIRMVEYTDKIRTDEQKQYIKDYQEKLFWAENGVIIDIWDNWGGDTLDYINITKFDYDKNSGRIYYLANYCVYGAVKYKSLYVYDLRTNELTNLHHDWQADR